MYILCYARRYAPRRMVKGVVHGDRARDGQESCFWGSARVWGDQECPD